MVIFYPQNYLVSKKKTLGTFNNDNNMAEEDLKVAKMRMLLI